MSMKNLATKSAAAFVLMVLISAGLNAQPPRPGQGQGFKKNTDRPCWNLSDEQKETMKTIQIEHQKKLTPLKNKMVELKAQQRTLMSEEVVDMKLVNKNIDDQTALMNKIQKLQAEHRMAVKEILNDEQEMMISKNQWKCRYPGTGSRGPGGACQYRTQ